MTTHLLAVSLLAVLTSGCVSTQIEQLDRSGSKPVRATNLKQFEGVYRNRAFETGEPDENTTELFVFLLGPARSHDRGRRVEIRSTPSGDALRLRLLDSRNRQLDAATLHRGRDFKFSRGAIVLHWDSSVLRTTSSNWGPGVEHALSRVHLTDNGSLLGRDASGGVALLMAVIPVATATRSFWLWPKEAQ
jgi:hypothetical protein